MSQHILRGLDLDDDGSCGSLVEFSNEELLDREPKQFRDKGLRALVDKLLYASDLCLREEYRNE